MAQDRPSLEHLTQRRRTLNGMYVGTFWRHTASKDLYRVNSIGIRESDYAAVVHYMPLTAPDMEWDRPLSEWLENTGSDDMPVPRFHRVHPTTTYAA